MRNCFIFTHGTDNRRQEYCCQGHPTKAERVKNRAFFSSPTKDVLLFNTSFVWGSFRPEELPTWPFLSPGLCLCVTKHLVALCRFLFICWILPWDKMNIVAIDGLPWQGGFVDHCINLACCLSSVWITVQIALKTKHHSFFFTRTVVANFSLVHKHYFIGLSLIILFKCHPSHTFSDETVPFQMRWEVFKNL